MFSDYLSRWGLIAAGPPVETRGSRLLPVMWRGQSAMLKVALDEEEKSGFELMAWWNGEGAARVFACGGDAILLELAQGKSSLAELCHIGRDDEACRIICSVISRLHETREGRPAGLKPLSLWFQGLEAAALAHGGILRTAHTTALDLLSAPREVRFLHGDIHHLNILDFGSRGWLAIDPKGLVGERAFDYANLFCNPDLEIASDYGRFVSRVDLVAGVAGLERERLLQWILAWAGLSAAWHMEDGTPAEVALKVTAMAAAELGGQVL